MQYSVHACARACSYCRFFMIASTRCICAAMSCRSWNHISLHTHTQNIYTQKVLRTHTQKSELGRSLVRKSVSRTFAPLYTRSLACHQCCSVLQCAAACCSVGARSCLPFAYPMTPLFRLSKRTLYSVKIAI